MAADPAPLIAGAAILIAALISLRLALSVAVIELVIGALLGNLGFEATGWMLYLASFGGIVLTYLAGTEVDTELLRSRLRESILVGSASFFLPFAAGTLFTYFVAGWSLAASLLAGTALSSTSLAVVYSVLVEFGQMKSVTGRLLMSYTFVTNLGTVIALSVIFLRPTLYTLVFWAVSFVLIVVASRYSHLLFAHPKLKEKVVETEIKYVFLLLLLFIYFAEIGGGQAVLPAFVLGLFMAKHFGENSVAATVRSRLRTVAYAIITPLFFIVAGIKLSLPIALASAGLVIALFALKFAAKFVAVFYLAKRYVPEAKHYVTLLMSTGLTFGIIAASYGLSSGILDLTEYSIIVAAVVASAIVPTFVAQKWFMPVSHEDLVGGLSTSPTEEVRDANG